MINYQIKWNKYKQWCKRYGYTIWNPFSQKFTDCFFCEKNITPLSLLSKATRLFLNGNFSFKEFNPFMTGVPRMRRKEKLPGVPLVWRCIEAPTQQQATAGMQADSGPAPHADFVVIRKLLFSSPKYTETSSKHVQYKLADQLLDIIMECGRSAHLS